jgi:hypothetical protein
MTMLKRALAVLLAGALCAACEGDGPSGGTPDGGQPPPSSGPRCEYREVPCTDEAIVKLTLKTAPNMGMVTSRALGNGVFESIVDATSGGIAPNTSYVYVRFDNQGLQKVAVGDEAAFTSMDWDVAFRRYVIRVNGGASGPSCVQAAVSDRTFDEMTAVPPALEYVSDAFLAPPACMVADDGSPLGGPLTAISEYFRYEQCLIMTGQAFVVRLRDGRHVGLEILAYYRDDVQAYCNTNLKLPGGQTFAGLFRLRWKFLPGG